MPLRLINGEEIIWKSFPGKRYRMFILFRDIFVSLFLVMMLYYTTLEYAPIEIEKTTLLLICSVLFGLGLFIALIHQIQFLLIQYFITNERVVIKRGFFNRRLSSVKLEHVLDIEVRQNFTERIIGVGTLYITNANDRQFDSGTEALTDAAAFKFIDTPWERHRELEQILEDHDNTTRFHKDFD